MKTIILFLTTTACLLAQGPLTPPGAPAPNMKTLDQIEPRTPISSLPYTISQPGSYYLTGNLQFTAASGDAITINASGVTLDLMGFTLSSTAGVTGNGISVPSASTRNICIRNGSVSGTTTVTVSGTPPVWTSVLGGFNRGISDNSTGGRFESLSITGSRSVALYSYLDGIIDRVHTSGNGGDGIYATSGSVTNSTSSGNVGNGIYAHSCAVTNSVCNLNGNYGIVATYGTVTNSTCDRNGAYGIVADRGSAMNATCRNNIGVGISADYGSVTNSNCVSNGTYGISASYGSVINCNCVTNSNIGIYATGCCVTNSTCRSNGSHGIFAPDGSVTNCTSTGNTGTDLSAANAAVAFCKFVTSNLTGATRTGNHPSP